MQPMDASMWRPLFKEGEHVMVEFGVGDPQLGKIIAVSDSRKMMTVRLGGGWGKGICPSNGGAITSTICWLAAE
jgi:hypothetical protein